MRRLLIPLSVAAMLACPAGASAAKKPVKLNFKVEGTQTTTWKYTKKQAPSCDWPEQGQGTQTIKFESVKKGVTLEATQKGDEIVFDEKGFLVAAEANLTASRDSLISQISPCPDGGGVFGGDGMNQDSHTNGKCKILGSIEFRVGTNRDAIWEPGDPARNTKKDPKDVLFFRGVPSWQGEGDTPTNLPAACEASGQPNADIGLSYGPVEWGGGLAEVGQKGISAKDLVTKKKIPVSGQVTIKYPNKVFREPGPSDTTGSTKVTLKVTITRAK